MEIAEDQYERIADCLPKQRGNVSLSNLQVLNAILYVAEHGCKWRGLPRHLGNWHTIYTRMNRWSKAGVLDRIFDRLQQEADSADSLRSGVAGQHDGQGAPRRDWGFEKSGPQAIGRSRGGCATKIHLVAAHARCALSFKLSSGQAGDAPEGRQLLRAGGRAPAGCHLVMDRAYEGDDTRQLAEELGYIPVVPPNPNRLHPWEYDRFIYRRRNEVERLFRRLKAFRRVFSRYDKLDVMFAAFVLFALMVDALRFSANMPEGLLTLIDN